jgi:ABC-type phosphate transport system substrate-binding protein
MNDAGRFRRNAALALAAALLASAAGAQEAAYKVIINAANPATSLKREQVAQLFLNRKVAWSHGPAGDAVDQSMTSPVRDAFSREVLGMPSMGVQNHWRKRLLETKEFPPLVKATDADVITHVAKVAGGIGYVSASTTLPATVKVLQVPDAIH